MNKIHTYYIIVLALAAFSVSACTQTTPSMMNQARVQLSQETSVEQIPIDKINDQNMSILANQYHKYGSGPLDLTMTFDPKSKKFTAMKAVQALKSVQSGLKQKGVHNMTAQTLAVPEGSPSLIVSYDMVQALAPSDCTPMPGMDDNQTGRFIGDYKFGCGVETAFAKQIARPSDLQGKSEMGPRAARRDSVMLQGYMGGVPREPLSGLETTAEAE